MTGKALDRFELWFVAGSQHLYGDEAIARVDVNAAEVAAALDAAAPMPVRVVHKPVVTTPEAIRTLCLEANGAEACVGLVVWMHMFSPARMWIAGLAACRSRSCTSTRSSTASSRGRDRHGLHEPQPVGPRRPRARIPRDASVAAA